MRSKCIRRVPVGDVNNHLLGVLTACDVTAFQAEELTEVARILPRRIKLEHATRNTVAK